MVLRLETIFPAVMVVLQVAACVPYWVQGDWRMGVYWMAAATLTVVVTW